jgi:hypothetical protein
MYIRTIFFAIVLVSLAIVSSCDGKKNESKTEATKKDTTAKTTTDTSKNDDEQRGATTIRAKYTDFQFGDISHFIFTDEAGKTWDFTEIDDMDLELASELPKSQSNDTNQGWGPNKSMLGKWFNVTYRTKTDQQYPDGPVGEVFVIVTATPVQ